MSRRSIDDARRFRRRTIRVLVDYACDEGVRCDYATTLGAGGLFIETTRPLGRGSVVKMRFRLPGSDALHEIEGRVCWNRGAAGDAVRFAPGMGVQFTDSTASSKLARELDSLD